MEEYQKRVLDEEVELRIKVVALRKFMDSPRSSAPAVPSRGQALLREQERHMSNYLHVLRDRIDGFEE